ncbi:glycosyltransferase family 2 protein [Oceaniglobus trochenteri]|uniref:glycosyltransferase family 2 protein n=1 Tax=Oceaniglobus trochenteri TaxID=2763260 RepID=UPI001CFF9B2D|nr:glycosyltransferase family 2 protein [Oceaniglobus trochenteri]
MTAPDLSIVTPVFNEQDSLAPFFDHLLPCLHALGKSFEVIAVDDGSSDDSSAILEALAARIPELTVVTFRRNFGQTAALMAGIDHSRGAVIVTLDSDMQNDPADIGALLDKLDEGFDVVSGWRKSRKDAAIRRNMVSRVANRLISKVTGVHLHDYGCTLKAYRREVLTGARLYGEMHRFIPIYAAQIGAKVTEIPVTHHARQFGASKYGLERIFKVILDLMVVSFLSRFFARPMYIFGGFGLVSLVVSLFCFIWMLALKIGWGVSMILTPLPVLVSMTFLVGIMGLLMGLLAEVLVRTYFESQDRKSYVVSRVTPPRE